MGVVRGSAEMPRYDRIQYDAIITIPLRFHVAPPLVGGSCSAEHHARRASLPRIGVHDHLRPSSKEVSGEVVKW